MGRGETRGGPQVPEGAGCLACLLCWAGTGGPRGRRQGWLLISALQGLHPPPLASSLNRRKGEAATGCKGGLGVILGCRAHAVTPGWLGEVLEGVWDQGIVELAPLTQVRKGDIN